MLRTICGGNHDAPHMPVLMLSISAACHQLIFLAIACNITSCTFIARSIAALGSESMLDMLSHPRRPQSGHLMCYPNRTYHVLPTWEHPCLDRQAIESYRLAASRTGHSVLSPVLPELAVAAQKQAARSCAALRFVSLAQRCSARPNPEHGIVNMVFGEERLCRLSKWGFCL